MDNKTKTSIAFLAVLIPLGIFLTQSNQQFMISGYVLLTFCVLLLLLIMYSQNWCQLAPEWILWGNKHVPINEVFEYIKNESWFGKSIGDDTRKDIFVANAIRQAALDGKIQMEGRSGTENITGGRFSNVRTKIESEYWGIMTFNLVACIDPTAINEVQTKIESQMNIVGTGSINRYYRLGVDMCQLKRQWPKRRWIIF